MTLAAELLFCYVEGASCPDRFMLSRRCFAAPWLIPVGLLFAPAPAHSNEDLSAKREVCRSEARQQIKSRSGGGVSLYEITLKARESYVRDCMARASSGPTETGSVDDARTPPAKREKRQRR
jgi:hypothetical protein